MNSLAVYIHWPFCVSKCPYCDFNSRPIENAVDEAAWENAYIRDLESQREITGPCIVKSIFFGGGTPSLMQPRLVGRLIDTVAQLWTLDADCEVSLEANPSSSETERFQAFRVAGVNRLSLGVQALDDEALRFLGRVHNAEAARGAIRAASAIFPRWSFDLIYAYAGQTAAAWNRTLDEALSFAPEHLSLYQLTIEEGTAFFKKARTQTLQVDEDLACELYEMTQDRLEKAGLPAYEISNHARAGQESRHNLAYWHYDDYVGIGPGAHGRVVSIKNERLATENIRHPQNWLNGMKERGCARERQELLTLHEAEKEALMMGLRLRTGIDSSRWKTLFNKEVRESLPAEKAQHLVKHDLLEIDRAGVRATSQGREKLNAVLGYLWS